MTDRPLRVMWLLNHTALRKFEVPQMENLGIREIFLPKSFPYDEGNLSASVDFSRDSALTVTPHDLEVLNKQNWYKSPSPEAWDIANRHFDVLLHGFFPDQIRSVIKNFRGAIVLHAFGLAGTATYSDLLRQLLTVGELHKFREISNRIVFGAGYEHLAAIEDDFIRSRHFFLPVGLSGQNDTAAWQGRDKKILFVCPRINSSEYFRKIYNDFVRNFLEFDYVVGGAQPIAVNDKRVLGFVDRATHDRNMRELAVMFYHGQEPNHIHYHPFEAIQSGMPLIFMSGGILDRFGGTKLPGRCTSVDEAKKKIGRILNGDRSFIENVRRSQTILLEPMKAENCAPHWRTAFNQIGKIVDLNAANIDATRPKKRRVAVIVPNDYRGGTLRAAKMIAAAVESGSRQGGDVAEVVFGHLDDPTCYSKEMFDDLPEPIERRPFRWRIMAPDEVTRACTYAGLNRPLTSQTYMAPDDGINQFMDCDLWIVISDRLRFPLLPVRPYLLMIYDYVQRYENLLDDETNQKFLARAHTAEAVLVTTTFTEADARQFAGIPAKKIRKVPMLAPEFSRNESRISDKTNDARFFIWTTNLAPHKNHENAFKALRLYYEKYAGTLECRVTGVDTKEIFKRDVPWLKMLRDIRRSSAALKQHLRIEGELADQSYQAQLGRAEFLWHPGRIDNGTFSVVEAAHLGVPALSSDYPAMREIDQQFALNMAWIDPNDPNDMARQLKQMETDLETSRSRLPSAEQLASQSVEKLAGAYWNVVRDYL